MSRLTAEEIVTVTTCCSVESNSAPIIGPIQLVVPPIIGMAIAYFAFNGIRASTMNWASFSQITFAFTVTPQLLVQGLIYSIVIGLFGGLMPSLRAARMPITTGLREL